jgi:hypothetical protein
MKNVKQASKLELFSAALFALAAMVLVFSCTKNIADVPAQDDAQLIAANASSQSSTRNSIVAVPFENTVFVSCANGGAGEDVLLTGKTNFVYQMAWNENGFTMVYHDNVHEVTGVGLSSGENFAASGGTQGTVRGFWFSNQWVGTTIQQLRIIGQNTSFTVNNKLQLVVTPDGKVTVNVREQTIDCN